MEELLGGALHEGLVSKLFPRFDYSCGSPIKVVLEFVFL